MDLKLSGKTALVTGASIGLGNAIARGLAAEGVKVCITARRRDLLEKLANEIVAAGGVEPVIVTCDMLEESAPQTLARDAIAAMGRVDIIANCAGGGGPPLTVEGDHRDEWKRIMTLNFDRVRDVTLAVLPSMMANRWGRVINLSGKSEVLALLATPSAKAAIHAWAKGLSRAVGKYNITVNSIAPGRIMSEQIQRKYSAEVQARECAEEIPLGRYGQAEELANLAVFLASPAADYITGTVMPVDGGLRRYAF